MKIGILGTGDVGRALGHGFVATGHEVMLGSRQGGNDKAAGWVKQEGAKASQGTFREAARFGEMGVLATLGLATQEAIRMAGPENFSGKVVLDATNPLDFSKGMPPVLVGSAGDSAGEKHQMLLPEAHVVKAFNTVGNAHFFRPQFPGGKPDMFICGDDAAAKLKVAEVCEEFGWGVVDVGGISAAHYLEAVCAVWVLSAFRSGNWNQAFKLLRR